MTGHLHIGGSFFLAFDTAPPLDVLVVPGGYGQKALMDDGAVLAFISRQAAGALWRLCA